MKTSLRLNPGMSHHRKTCEKKKTEKLEKQNESHRTQISSKNMLPARLLLKIEVWAAPSYSSDGEIASFMVGGLNKPDVLKLIEKRGL